MLDKAKAYTEQQERLPRVGEVCCGVINLDAAAT